MSLFAIQSLLRRLALAENGDTLSQVSWCLAILVAVGFLAVTASHYVGVPWGDFVADGLR